VVEVINPPSPDYWVGNLAMTLAVATVTPDPQAILRPSLRKFLKDRPPGDELGDMIRQTLKEKR
jgi:hypothetical protein